MKNHFISLINGKWVTPDWNMQNLCISGVWTDPATCISNKLRSSTVPFYSLPWVLLVHRSVLSKSKDCVDNFRLSLFAKSWRRYWALFGNHAPVSFPHVSVWIPCLGRSVKFFGPFLSVTLQKNFWTLSTGFDRTLSFNNLILMTILTEEHWVKEHTIALKTCSRLLLFWLSHPLQWFFV